MSFGHPMESAGEILLQAKMCADIAFQGMATTILSDLLLMLTRDLNDWREGLLGTRDGR